MRIPSGLYIDNPAWPLLQAHVSYWGITSGAGNVLGTTLVDANLVNEPSYVGLAVKILDGGAAGQVRPVQAIAAGVITVTPAFTNSAGAVQQIAAGVRFVILSFAPGGGGVAPSVSPSIGLWMFGVCDPGMAASTTALLLTNLAGFPNDIFNNEFWIQVIHNTSAPGTAPEREIRRVTDYVGATGTFTCDAFTVNVEANDLVAVFHESILPTEILGFGTLDTSSATAPADSTRTEGDDYFNGHLLMPTEGAVRFQPRRIVDYTGVGGIFTLDPNNPFTAASGTVDYVIIGDQTEFVPGVDGANNRTPSDVVGNKTDTIPAMNLVPGDDSTVRHLKAILERVGATPADPDDSLLTTAGQRDDAATSDDMSALDTASLHAKIRRVLLRLATNAFTATIQGAALTELDVMLGQLATYVSALGAAYSAAVNPGAVAKTNIEETLEDLGNMLAGAAGIATFPAAAAPADGVSLAEVIRQIYNDLVAVNSGFQEQPDVAVNITAIAAGETDVLNLAAAGTRYLVRSLRLKSADPGANTVTVRLYELVNDVLTVVDTFSMTTANFGTVQSLMDMFGLPHLAGDQLQVTVQASGGGPYAITGQYSWASAT